MVHKLIAFGLALALNHAPLYLDLTDQSLKTLRAAGYEIKGRDPCDGTGLCCALLPANLEREVFYVTLPDTKYQERHFALLKRFPNLKQIRANRVVSETEYAEIMDIVPSGTSVIVSVLEN